MIRMFKVTKKIENQIYASADIEERLYLNGTGLYNAHNKRVCDMDSDTFKDCLEEIYMNPEDKPMFNFFIKPVPTKFVRLCDKDIEADRVHSVLEDFYDDDNINDYRLNSTVVEVLVKLGVLVKHPGSRMATLYSKTDKFEGFYKRFMEEFYDSCL